MTPADQTNDLELGNCLQACVATILDLPMQEVPDFIRAHGPRWFMALRTWLRPRGKHAVYVSTLNSLISHVYPHELPWIGIGDGPRGVRHAVVCLHKEIVHDPHPSREGLAEIEDALIIVP